MEQWQKVTQRALDEIEAMTIYVGDSSEAYFDLESSRNMGDIVEAVEATESPVVSFVLRGTRIGWLLVIVGYGDESIVDYPSNEFMNKLMEGEF